jgi:PAS domain S-box-containing protein
MIFKEWLSDRFHLDFAKFHLSGDFKEGAKRHHTELNFQRARLLAILLFLTNFVFLYSDYLSYQKGIWSINRGYIFLFYSHMALGTGMLLLIVASQLIKRTPRTEFTFALLTAVYILFLSVLISGGVDQFLHQQITVYIIAVFTISALLYFNPRISAILYMFSYIGLVLCLQFFQPNYDVARGHYTNGGLLVLVAWFFSANHYRLRIRDFQYQTNLEGMVAQRTARLEELNSQLTEEILERQRLDDEMTHFFKATPDLICFMTFKGILTRVNCAFHDLLGYREEDFTQQSFFSLVHPEDKGPLEETFRECFKAGNCVFKSETRLRCKNGEYLSMECSAVLDFEQKLIFAVARDITERKRNQEKVYRLASIVESTDDGIIGMSTNGIIQYWNPGAEQVYGYTAEEIIGKTILTIIADNRHDELQQILKNILRGEKISHFETERLHKDGRSIEVSLTVSPINDDSGKIIGISTIVRDVSHHKRMERELTRLDRMNLIGEMAASISHEVRNPMTTVRGFMQLLYDKEECAKFQVYFDLMISELDRANSILSEFLSISRTKMTERRRQNLNSVVNLLVPLIEASAISKNMKIKTKLGELPDLMLDDKEIRQVILNLSRNGIEAMDEGGVLTIRTYEEPENQEVILEIQDEGHGISPDLIERLGTPFLTTKNDGTGLGLAICFGIVSRHDGRIEVVSTESGSTFRVRFRISN